MSESSPFIKQLDHAIDLLRVHESHPDKYPFLLESVAKTQGNASFDILFAYPQAHLKLNAAGELSEEKISLPGEDVFTRFNQWFEQEKSDWKLDLPFYGGWFVFLAYEFAQQIEPVLDLPLDKENILPVAQFTRIPAAVLQDHGSGKTMLVAEPGFEHLLDEMLNDVQHVSSFTPKPKPQFILSEEEPARYIEAVRKIKNYIIEGDVFQVNLSRVWQATVDEDITPADVYRNLRQANPAPFAGLACFANAAVISSSPERLVKVEQGLVDTRPIAGTRPRVRNAQGEVDDQANMQLKDELIGHPKERAEHVMLIDLERNDLGRVCKPGSVEVNELMVLETYEHVHHIVSNVRGRLQDDILPMDVIKAVFPGGTITGCPKVRCMEIIAELEQAPRLAYTGSMGYINRNGDMDLNILIRTIIQHNKEFIIRAGAGIVADSDPEKELQETRAKAKGMLNAL